MTTAELLKDDATFELLMSYIERIKDLRFIRNQETFWELMYDIENQMLSAGFETDELDRIIKAVR